MHLSLFGAALDTPNLGVTALGLSVLHALADSGKRCGVTLFDFGRGKRPLNFAIDDASGLSVEQRGGFLTKRYYLNECLWNIRFSARAGGLWNAGARALRQSTAVLDISGGDSFTDLYGPWRFASVSLPKSIAIEQRIPLFLLPQTYGPFESDAARKEAKRIVRSAHRAWARDRRSFDVLRELLGDAFDAERHKETVDVAFALPTVQPSGERFDAINAWLSASDAPVAGLNVSGLLMNRPDTAQAQYRLKADYAGVVCSLAQRILEKSDARLLLVPHVNSPIGHYESDIEACAAVAAKLPQYAERLYVCPALSDPREIKWVIRQCDWFCGTRMHSTIAALSTGVATAAIAYSPKTLGVFETCGQGSHVADPRQLDTETMVDRLWQSYEERVQARESLQAALPAVMQRAQDQMDDLVGECQRLAEAARSAGNAAR